MADFEVGINFWPWEPLPEIVSFVEIALKHYAYDQVWFCDNFQYEDIFMAMALVASKHQISLGTSVTFPSRNPLDLASRFSSLSKLMSNDVELSLGIARGGPIQEQIFRRDKLVSLRETLCALRQLMNGEPIILAEYPYLSRQHGFRTAEGVSARLFLPPERKIPIYVGVGGPRIKKMAAELSDGYIMTTLGPEGSIHAIRDGLLAKAVDQLDEMFIQAGNNSRHKKIFNLLISVSNDSRRAIEWAKRNASYGLYGYYHYYPNFLTLRGIRREEIAKIAEKYERAEGPGEAAKLLTDELFHKYGGVLAGNPRQCVEVLEDILPHIKKAGFDQVVIAVPIGPDVPEALKLIGDEILPTII